MADIALRLGPEIGRAAHPIKTEEETQWLIEIMKQIYVRTEPSSDIGHAGEKK